MILKVLLCLTLCAYSTAARKAEYTYMNELKGPQNSKVRTFGNFAFANTNYPSSAVNAQMMINQIATYYNCTTYGGGAEYSLQYYRDSSLSTVLYVLYQKINFNTNRFYALRVETGIVPGKVYYLGKDTCQLCRPGRQMPYLTYQQVSPFYKTDNSTVTKNLIDIINNVKNYNNAFYLIQNIRVIKIWTLPEAILYIPIIKIPENWNQIYFLIMKNPEQYLVLLGRLQVPYINGNIPIDYAYLSQIIKLVFDKYNITSSKINLFEYYLDPLTRDFITYSATFHNQVRNDYTKIMGNVKKNLTSKTNYFPYVVQEVYRNVSKNEQTYYSDYTYIDRSYQVLGEISYQTILNPIQSILKHFKYPQSSLCSFQYIQYPNNKKQYLIVINQSIEKKISQIYYSPQDQKIVIRKLAGNSSFNSKGDWESQIQKVYQYTNQYELLTGYQYSSTQAYQSTCPYYQYCSLKQIQLQIMICIQKPRPGFQYISISGNPCLNQSIFLKNIKANRITFLGNSTIFCNKCDFGNGLPNPRSYCPNIKAQKIEKGSDVFSKIYSFCQKNFTNSKAQKYQREQFYFGGSINTDFLGVRRIHYLKFMKKGVISAFNVEEVNSKFTVVDYIEAFSSIQVVLQPQFQKSINNNL